MFRNSCVILANVSISRKNLIFDQFSNIIPNQLAINRYLFNSISDNTKNRTKEYVGRKLVGFSMQQMYTVVSDVGNYKRFIPFCKKSLILSDSPEFMRADLVIGFPPLIESYSSNVTLVEPYLVKSVCTEGRLFHHLESIWKFSPALKNNPQSCIIDFYLSFEFRSLLHSHLANIFFDKLVQQMEIAFINEARNRYGRESLRSRQLDVMKS